MKLFTGLDADTADAALVAVRRLRVEADAAEASLLVAAAHWADLHPAAPEDAEAFDDDNLPSVAWDAPAELGAALGTTTEGARHRIHEALEALHRLPKVWARMLAGQVPAWRVRRIAQTTLRHPGDVAACVDHLVAPVAHRIGGVTLDRLLDETLMRLYPEQREQDQLDELDRRGVDLFDQVGHNGVCEMRIRADLKDLYDFNDTVAAIAEALAADGSPDSLDVRRSLAVGILADPAQAADLLDRDHTPDSVDRTPAARPRPPRKRAVLVLHLSEAALLGIEPVGRCEKGSRPMLEQQIREWAGRSDTHLTIQPVIDLADHDRTDSYEIPDRIKLRVDGRDRACAFPWCNRPARACDHDHTVPHAQGGATCDCNLVPLCRHHHRLKTLTAWTYTTVEPGVYLWRSPHGYRFLRNHEGTTDVTTPGHGDPGDGCHRGRAP